VMESSAGHQDHALRLAERALALLGEGSDVRNLARLRTQVGAMMLRVDPPNPAEAQQLLERAREEFAASSVGLVDRARCDVNLAMARLLQGDPGSAQQLAEAALTEVTDAAPLFAANAHIVLGRIHMASDDRPAAREQYQAAAAALTGIGSDRAVAQTWFELATLLEHVGDSDGSRDAYRNAAAATGLRLPEAETRLQPAY